MLDQAYKSDDLILCKSPCLLISRDAGKLDPQVRQFLMEKADQEHVCRFLRAHLRPRAQECSGLFFGEVRHKVQDCFYFFLFIQELRSIPAYLEHGDSRDAVIRKLDLACILCYTVSL